jgi:hypothetical protein
MKKLFRIILSIILISCGIGVVIFGISLLFHNQNLTLYAFFGFTAITGSMLVLSGLSILSGDKIRDVIETLIISL